MPPDTHPSIRLLYEVQQREKPQAIQKLIDVFQVPRDITIENFIIGIRTFIEYTNMGLEDRIARLGSPYFGFNDHAAIANLCNKSASPDDMVYPQYHLWNYSPHSWNYVEDEFANMGLIYTYSNPADALMELLQGPVALDCGEWCQLAIWFGILYMLGNQRFNNVFGYTFFCLTQENFGPIPEFIERGDGLLTAIVPFQQLNGSPLFGFMNKEPSPIGIHYIRGAQQYLIKHPMGHAQGFNALFIQGAYSIFSPDTEKTSGLSEHDIRAILLDAYNSPPTPYDIERLNEYASKPPDQIHRDIHMPFIEIPGKAAQLKSHEACLVDMPKGIESSIYFNFERLKKEVEAKCRGAKVPGT